MRIIGRAHPRVCGENLPSRRGTGSSSGSSPRVRGKRLRTTGRLYPRGLIPACAGKTLRLFDRSCKARAHPRVCGENPPCVVLTEGSPGSSPRVRGKPPARFKGIPAYGLIPACAGKTRLKAPWASAVWAHPRVCGENQLMPVLKSTRAGSSPRVRGKLSHAGFTRCTCRLIPACAGKTASATLNARQAGAHPRVCGENLYGVSKKLSSKGSSPRVRGKHPVLRPSG